MWCGTHWMYHSRRGFEKTSHVDWLSSSIQLGLMPLPPPARVVPFTLRNVRANLATVSRRSACGFSAVRPDIVFDRGRWGRVSGVPKRSLVGCLRLLSSAASPWSTSPAVRGGPAPRLMKIGGRQEEWLKGCPPSLWRNCRCCRRCRCPMRSQGAVALRCYRSCRSRWWRRQRQCCRWPARQAPWRPEFPVVVELEGGMGPWATASTCVVMGA